MTGTTHCSQSVNSNDQVIFTRILSLALLERRLNDAADVAATFASLAADYGSPLALTLAELLQARANRALGKGLRAASSVRKALSTLANSAACRLFLDQGAPIVAIVQKIAEMGDPAFQAWEDAILEADRLSVNTRSVATKSLTPREQDVLHALAKYASTKEMARHMSLAPETVRYHLKSIYLKFGVHTRAAALAFARAAGLLRFDDCHPHA